MDVNFSSLGSLFACCGPGQLPGTTILPVPGPRVQLGTQILIVIMRCFFCGLAIFKAFHPSKG